LLLNKREYDVEEGEAENFMSSGKWPEKMMMMMTIEEEKKRKEKSLLENAFEKSSSNNNDATVTLHCMLSCIGDRENERETTRRNSFYPKINKKR
jgi:hypothetical protein